MIGVPDQIPSQPSQIPSQSIQISGSPGVPSHRSKLASSRVGSFAGACHAFLPQICFSLWAVRCIPLPQRVGPQGHHREWTTEQAQEAPHSIQLWAAWRCGLDSRGRPCSVHLMANAQSAPQGADSGEARVHCPWMR